MNQVHPRADWKPSALFKRSRWLLGLLSLLLAVPLPALAQPQGGGPQQTVPVSAPAPAGFRHEYAQVNGITLHYLIGGTGTPLVLLHGWPETWFEWQRVMPALATDYTVIVPDMRGAGESSKPVDGYTKRQMADDIYKLVLQLGYANQPINLVGHDIGMMVAYAYAAEHPTGVRKLVLSESLLPGVEPYWSSLLADPRGWYIGFHTEGGIAEVLVKDKERDYLVSFYTKWALNPTAFTEVEIAEESRAYAAPGAMAASFKWYRTFSQDAQENQALLQTPLTMPVLALGGATSSAFLLPLVQQVAPHATGYTIPNCGHWLAQEQPTALVQQLKSFFQ